MRNQRAPEAVVLPGYVIDIAAEQLRTEDGAVCDLRPQAFAVLKQLALHTETLVTKKELLTAVWSGMTVTDDSLVQAISDVRRALNDSEHRLIRTVHRRGYVLLRRAAAPKNAPSVGPAAVAGLGTFPVPAQARGSQFHGLSAARLGGLILAIIATAAAIFVVSRQYRHAGKAASA